MLVVSEAHKLNILELLILCWVLVLNCKRDQRTACIVWVWNLKAGGHVEGTDMHDMVILRVWSECFWLRMEVLWTQWCNLRFHGRWRISVLCEKLSFLRKTLPHSVTNSFKSHNFWDFQCTFTCLLIWKIEVEWWKMLICITGYTSYNVLCSVNLLNTCCE